MVKRCAYSLCNSDDRYKDRTRGVSFHPFPKPKTNLQKCLRWIKQCNRPHHQLNVDTINRSVYVCSKHFVGGNGPTYVYPDPVPLSQDTNFTPKPPRPLPKRRKLDFSTPRSVLSEAIQNEEEKENTTSSQLSDSTASCIQTLDTDVEICVKSAASQTDSTWVDPIDMLGIAVENRALEQKVETVEKQKVAISKQLCSVSKQCTELYSKVHVIKQNKTSQTNCTFSGLDACELMVNDKQFKYYTGFTPEQYNGIYKFLVPSDSKIPFDIPQNREKSMMELELINQLLLTILNLRHNYDYADLAFRFGVLKQTAGLIFTTWINYMFLRFGEVSIWPHRDIIKTNMPEKFSKEFPTTFAIFDCTEIKICKPSSLKSQSQTYSDYKSTNTLKGLVACDPRGSLIFASILFSGSISDKEIFVQSGCKNMLEDLVKEGYLKIGDCIIADKGFNVENLLKDCGLELNIPPFARQGAQMSESDALLTKKIASHRVHVERAIARIKKFKILAGRMPLGLFSCVNQIWYVCAFLTNFFPPCIQDKSENVENDKL